MLIWAFLGFVLFAINVGLAKLAQNESYVTYVFVRTLLWSLIPYALAVFMLHRSLHLPSLEGNSLVGLATTIPFGAQLLLFAAFHVDYSRGAHLLAYITTLSWTWLGYRSFVRNYIPVFGYTDASALQQLNTILRMPGAAAASAAHFKEIGSLQESINCDALMMERRVMGDPERTRRLAQLKLSHIHMYSVERVGEMLTGRVGLTRIEDDFLNDYCSHYFYSYVKRIIDLLIVSCLLPFALPISFAVALAVRLESPGPALFRQKRVGLYGKSFTLFKFRSMQYDVGAPAQFASRGDPRVTRVGRLIRKYRLDEIPQLWNVLKGDMSMIGPRPEQGPMVDQFTETIPYYPYRHLVPPGLSGWAQVSQGYVGSHEGTVTKLSYDLYYVKHCSLSLDLLIAVKTLRTLLTGYGAR
jgi:exopolysaccharide biosynthesis polyprenyl glycosylphosphotransferase